jgi:hypothetical protein
LVHDRQVYENLNQTAQQARKGVVAFQENMEALKGNFFFRGFFKDRGYTDSSELAKNELQKLPAKEIKKSSSIPQRISSAKRMQPNWKTTTT